MFTLTDEKGFTLIELIIVMAIIALVAVAVFVSVDPAERLGDTKDAIRAADKVAIEKAIQQSIADGQAIPVELAALTVDTPYMLVTEGGSEFGTAECATLDLSINRVDLAASFKSFIGQIPVDGDAVADDTGYYLIRRGNSFYCEPCNAYGDTYDPGAFAYYRSVTVQNSQVSSTIDLTNFPMLFSGTYSYLATVANGGKAENINGYDIAFSLDSSGTSLLDYEIESYSSSTGEVAMWVEIPTLDYNDDTVIYLLYGSTTISVTQENITGVWDSNYQAVWHLAESSGTHYDSTANDIDSSAVSVTTQGTISGKINGADNFNNVDNYVDFGNVLELDLPVTVSAWVYKDTLGNSDHILNSNDGNAVYDGYFMHIGGDNKLEMSYGDGEGVEASDRRGRKTTGTIPETDWTYVVGIIESESTNDIHMYIDGSSDDGADFGSATSYQATNAGETFKLGYRSNWGTRMGGNIDEVRVSNVSRSGDWVATEYNNQNSPATFYSIGAE